MSKFTDLQEIADWHTKTRESLYCNEQLGSLVRKYI